MVDFFSLFECCLDPVRPYEFDMAEIEGFRYRVNVWHFTQIESTRYNGPLGCSEDCHTSCRYVEVSKFKLMKRRSLSSGGPTQRNSHRASKFRKAKSVHSILLF